MLRSSGLLDAELRSATIRYEILHRQGGSRGARPDILSSLVPKMQIGTLPDLFVSGNDAEAKARATELLKSWFGWRTVIDLGDITTARGPEMLLAIWVRLYGALGTGMFNFKIAR